ncbi:VWA domain-containing protein [Pseudoalteromonas shioyasakiensis]|uniref:vWA domain-containing protein n=1 Tax=Pseudoalteromonas sp. 2102 TaxID=2743616 RepID=UPI001582796C|nr:MULTISPECIES: VWA domain-containing protein [Pseudoalteromonas]MDI4672247.1 VWA domain-containing protein [Pseudoalteromonas shioyasakiensis]NUJ34593.1 VWA domain-containing protein [Pseudoalteromonas sp. 1701]NUJ69223.1 VWA domain-containing protein [Pseudoalteromonas sp. 2102]
MNKSKLLKRFRMLSRVMSNRGDITINLTGNRCYTDYNSITLPVGDLENPDYLELLEGAIDHEVGHLRWTDRTWTAKSYEKGAFFNAIRNGIEDIRMERMVCLEWPGAILNLSKMVTQGIKKGWFSKPTDSFPPSLLLQAVVVYYGRYKINDQVQLKEFCEIALALLTDCIGQKPVHDLILLLDTIPALRSNQHSYELTEQIIQLLKKIEFKPGDSQGNDSGDSQGNDSGDSQDSQGNDSGDSQGDDSGDSQGNDSGDSQGDDSGDSQGNDSGDSQGDDSGDSQGNDSGDSQGDDSGDSQGDDSGDSQGNDSGDSQGQNSSVSQQVINFVNECLNADESQLMADLHEQVNNELEKMADEVRSSNDMEQLIDLNAPLISKNDRGTVGTAELNLAKRLSTPISRELHKIIYGLDRKSVNFSKQGRTVEANRLAGVKAGNFNVFKSERITKAPTMAISVLVDRSSSMSAVEMNGANTSALAINLAIDKLKGVNSECIYYSAGDLYEAKCFKSTTKAVKDNFRVSSRGGTHTGLSLYSVIRRLSLRVEQKKVVFIITDGQASDLKYLEKSIEMSELLGIQIVCIGINTGMLYGFENQELLNIQTVEELPSILKQVIKNKLIA